MVLLTKTTSSETHTAQPSAPADCGDQDAACDMDVASLSRTCKIGVRVAKDARRTGGATVNL